VNSPSKRWSGIIREMRDTFRSLPRLERTAREASYHGLVGSGIGGKASAEERDPYSKIVEECDFDSYFDVAPTSGPPLPEREALMPLRHRVHLWLAGSDDQLKMALSLVLGAEQLRLPGFAPLGIVSGSRGRVFEWRFLCGKPEDKAVAIDGPLVDLLFERNRESIAILESRCPLLPPDTTVLVWPALTTNLDPRFLDNPLLRSLRICSVTWFEQNSGAVAARNVKEFLATAFQGKTTHIVLPGLCSLGPAVGTDQQAPIIGLITQFARFSDEVFRPWLHILP
jgi:hypothetical protein